MTYKTTLCHLALLNFVFLSNVTYADPDAPAPFTATAEYNAVTGTFLLNIAGAASGYVNSMSSSLQPSNLDAPPADTFLFDRSDRVGLARFQGVNVINWGGSIGAALDMGDLFLSYLTQPGGTEVMVAAGDEGFRFVDELNSR